MSTIQKTAMITLAGRPNVGKSTLTNALVGEKVAIVSPKPQTTRNRICGVVNRGDTQLVLVDTPGLHRAKNKLGDYMVKVARQSVASVDAVCLMVEPIANVGTPERAVIDLLRQEKLPSLLVINKIDTVEKPALLAVMAAYGEAYDFDAIIPVSALTGDGLEELTSQLLGYAAPGPQLFPEGETSDQPERRVVSEIVREKLLRNLDQEVPHGAAVEVVRFVEDEKGLIHLEVTIYCEKDSHKGIIIGRNGAMLKKISTQAREEIERFMGAKVYMETWVKLKENWRNNPGSLRGFGYDEQ